jgi:hypothetical protein
MFPCLGLILERGIRRPDSTRAVASDLSSVLGQEMVRGDTETIHLTA